MALALVVSLSLMQLQPALSRSAPQYATEAQLASASYTVVMTQCLLSGLMLQSMASDPVLPYTGNFLLNSAHTATDPAELCTDCGQYGAIVSAVGEPQACASGATPCVEVQLTTRPALLSEILFPEALQPLGRTNSSDVTLFEVVTEGCWTPGATEMPRPGRAGGATLTAPENILLRM